jgi:hypothetical protein
MNDPTSVDKEGVAPSASGQRWGVRFSPHVLVFLLTVLVSIPPLRGVIVSWIHWWWTDSYVQVDYVMEEARPNDGSPYIAGHLEGSTEQQNLVGLMQGSTIVPKAAPQEAFEAGKRILVWHSPSAPSMVVFGTEVNTVPVAALPVRPGLLHLIGYFAWLTVTWMIGWAAIGWVARRWSRDYGVLRMDRQARRRIRE